MQALSCRCCGRISLEKTKSVSEGLVAKLEEQAAETTKEEDDEGESTLLKDFKPKLT